MAGLGPTIVFKSGVPELVAIPIVRSATVLGKHPTCDVVLANPFVSRQHAQIELSDGRAIIRDLASKNGTYVNGMRIGNDPSELADGATIEFGRSQVTAVFHLADSTVTLDNISINQADPIDSNFVIDNASRQVWIAGEALLPALTKKEFDILLLLNSKQGQVCSHAEIARAGWPERGGAGVDETEIRQYVRRIRVRFDSAPVSDARITTLRGSGYRLDLGS
ncbi:MAG: FHA domain-containing protein [Dehalococcoidia bacterium]